MPIEIIVALVLSALFLGALAWLAGRVRGLRRRFSAQTPRPFPHNSNELLRGADTFASDWSYG